MTKNKSILFLLLSLLGFTASAQNNSLIGLLRTSNPASIRLGKLDLTTGIFSQLSTASIGNSFNATGAALDPNSGTYFFLGAGGMLSVDVTTGSVVAQNALTNPIATSYFDNFRFNTSDSSLYGLARRYIQTGGQGVGELYLATINPSTGVITQISPQSVGQSYALQGNAIDPHLMVYYYSIASQFVGLDMYTGLVYSSPTISFPQGGLYFDNFTYNCADTSIYGLIRMNTTAPLTVHFGKINPQTGVVTQISQQPIAYSMFSVSGSSTIDPNTGTYYYLSVLPQGGKAVVGISIQTGSVASVDTIPTTGNTQTYFDMMRNPSDCFGAQAYRPDSSGGSADINVLAQSLSKVFPNPFTDQLTISSVNDIDAYTIRDIHGKIVAQDNHKNTTLTIETAHLVNGIYFLEIKSATNVQLVKLIKE